jgi:drug/metabolite transporter (DMT)-like permease
VRFDAAQLACSVAGSFLILGEVPTAADMIGFALIFVASACVLLTRQSAVEPASQAA